MAGLSDLLDHYDELQKLLKRLEELGIKPKRYDLALPFSPASRRKKTDWCDTSPHTKYVKGKR